MIRKLLISTTDVNRIEQGLKRMYLKRVQEMFIRTVNVESIFNVFDEVFHGLARASEVNDKLYSFYEAMLIITSYYQHSQAGRGSLVAQLLEDLGNADKMEFELKLTRLPNFLDVTDELEETELTRQKFDIVSRISDNLVFCESKMKVYSGCTAGRIELMEKFNKISKLIIDNPSFRRCIEKGNI